MTKQLISAAVLALLASSSAWAIQSEDDAAIKKRHGEWTAAWDKHDPKAMAAFFTEDGDVINPFGRRAKGIAEIEKLFTEEHAGPMAKSTYSGTIESIRYLGKEVAVVDVVGEIKGMKGPDGADMAPFKHRVVWIAINKDGTWKAACARAFATPPPPAAPAK